MNILIIGANGLLGRELVTRLSRKNHVYALVKQNDIENINKNSNVTFIKADLFNLNERLLPLQIDTVYYLAQSRRFREFPKGAIDMLQVNIVSSVKIAEWARKKGVKKFIYASSGGIYHNQEGPVKEFSKININNNFGYYIGTKISAEILLRNYIEYFETFAIIRPFFIYGPYQNKDMLIPSLVNSVIYERAIYLSGKEGIKINPIYVSDAAIACEKILNLKRDHIFNIAGNEVISLKNFALMIADIVGKKPVFEYTKKVQNNLIGDTDLMRSLLHSPVVCLKEGIRILTAEDVRNDYNGNN